MKQSIGTEEEKEKKEFLERLEHCRRPRETHSMAIATYSIKGKTVTIVIDSNK
jgi:hypothetical protein